PQDKQVLQVFGLSQDPSRLIAQAVLSEVHVQQGGRSRRLRQMCGPLIAEIVIYHLQRVKEWRLLFEQSVQSLGSETIMIHIQSPQTAEERCVNQPTSAGQVYLAPVQFQHLQFAEAGSKRQVRRADVSNQVLAEIQEVQLQFRSRGTELLHRLSIEPVGAERQ